MFDRRLDPGSGATSPRAGLDASSTTAGQRSNGNASSPTRAIAATARKPLWVGADLDALLHAAAEQEHRNGRHILLITGGFSANRPAFRRRVEACLAMRGVVWTFACGGPVTDTELVPACVALMTERDVGLVVALGGGRVMDFAKVCTTFRDFDLSTDIELILGQRHDLIPRRRTALITIPTTPGTGSEATPYAVLTGRRNRKLFAISAAFLPDAGLVCPELYVTVPPEVIRQGALDALTHALEALWAKRATQLSDAYAAQAMDHFHAAFLQFYRNPGDLWLAET
ncbi:MAG: iron-containing alcohol dehydrogenase, partial [Gammaproteobacteria bacterium]